MGKKEKTKKVKPWETERVSREPKKPKKKVVVGVEKKKPLILFSFPNIDGVRISVKARTMDEAIKKAKKEVRNLGEEVS